MTTAKALSLLLFIFFKCLLTLSTLIDFILFVEVINNLD